MINRVQRVKLYIVLFLHQTTTYPLPISKYHSLYIVLFLHQTTTLSGCRLLLCCCISYYSYIKPQLDSEARLAALRCISYYSYIKPQLQQLCSVSLQVVYRTIPTSNHNIITDVCGRIPLYIVLFLHQTTTPLFFNFFYYGLYIVLFLHQTTT